MSSACKSISKRLVYAGFMTAKDVEKLESLNSDFNKYWMPLTWFSNLAAQAREEGRVKNDVALKLLMEVGLPFFPLKIGKNNVITSLINQRPSVI